VQALVDGRITSFGMESIPRATRAQRMDALSSQATVAGYKAVLIAADRLPRFMPIADDCGRNDPAFSSPRNSVRNCSTPRAST